MRFIRKAVKEAKILPKGLWIVALIVPFGLIAAGAWVTGKGIYDSRKKISKT